jgi:MarR family 2-MHQ and catechol resistance regulon transcriptional repressor
VTAETAPDTKQSAIESLSFVSGYLYRIVRYEARDLGIRWTALMVLKDLALLGPCTQRTLCDVEQVTEPTMTVLLDQMQQRGWITRNRDPNNARSKRVTITAKGARELANAGRVLRERLGGELAGLSATELGAIGAALAPLVALLMNKIEVAQRELQA